MGAYCYLSIDNRVVWDQKHWVLPGMDVLFVRKDRYERSLPPQEASERGLDIEFGYRTSLRAARFRLVLAGYGPQALRRAWSSWPSLHAAASEYSPPDPRFYEQLSFDEYMQLLKKITLNTDAAALDTLSEREEYVLYCPSGHDFAFPSNDPVFALSALLHAVEGTVLDIDVSEMRDNDIDSMVNGWRTGHLIIITEGKSDTEFLKNAFVLLAPDLMETVRFFDYDYRPPGGSGHNLNLLKSLAAAGIRSPIVALFDNDTTGHEAVQEAASAGLPNNFWVGTYPLLPLGASYPTLGPSGMQLLDINGSACAIELYLGRDCLEVDGNLVPVQWTGYNHKMRRYQGELLDKRIPQDKFREKLRLFVNSGNVSSQQYDFTGVISILETIEHAAGTLILSTA